MVQEKNLKDMKVMCAHDEIVEVHKLVKNPRNPNKHTQEQIQLLAKIMKHQGFRNPIVVSTRSGFITKGHGRLDAAVLNKWEWVPVDYQDYETEADEYADMVADNKIAELAETDMSMVHKDLLEIGPFDPDLLGIPDFRFEPTQEFIDKINQQIETAEWVNMPDWEPGEGYIRISLMFASKEAREKYVNENNIKIDRKVNENNWICLK